MAITQDESKLIAIFVQSVLYGALVVMFVLTYWNLVYHRRPGRKLNKTMLCVAITMFLLATLHLIVNFIRIWRGLFTYRDIPGSYWNHLSDVTQVLGSAVIIAQTMVGDGVAVYRCYVVWNCRKRYTILPMILYLGGVATGIGTLVGFGRLLHAEVFHLRPWIIAFFTCTLATSVTCTVTIAARIWFLNRHGLGPRPGRHLHDLMCIILESGAIYSSTLIVLLVLFETKSWFQYVVVDAITPIIGLVFSIIIVRIGLGLSTEGAESASNATDCQTTLTLPRNWMTDGDQHHIHVSASQGLSPLSPSPSRLWPVQPNRQLAPQVARKKTIRGHYNLRSQAPYLHSYFRRSSAEIDIDADLEFDVEEARYQRPKALPITLFIPHSDHSHFP